ncbi:hypothetical protein ACHAXA_011271 [Cyclostephanos tholiformis]|uniref:Uncharacterized protein n=1 Tax=Cyclostephanos tholiformis TaxID=382380 RepID=A0ABD3SQB5_9STRA
MIAKKIIWKRFQSSPDGNHDGDEEQSGEKQMSQYQLCVDEIKKEGNVLGSLELHEEAMRRLKHHSPRASDEGVANGRDVSARRHAIDRRTGPPQTGGNIILSHIGFMVNGRHGRTASDPSREKMAGRRQSTFKPVEYDEGVTAAQVLQDLDLSDSEDEGVDDHPIPSSCNVANGDNNSGGRRGSILRRASLTFGRKANATICRPLRTAVRRYSNPSSLDLSEFEGEEHVPPAHSPTSLPGRRAASISNIGRRPVRRYLKRRSTVSTDGGNRLLVSKTGDDADQGGGNILHTKNYAETHASNVKREGISITNVGEPIMRNSENFETNVTKSLASWQRRRRTTTGKRRSSLFSHDERRASIDRSSLSSGCNGSMTEDSMTGSITWKVGDGSLICSFHSRNSFTESYAEDGGLICDWERRHSMISDSSCAKSNQDGLLNGNDVDVEKGSLICGWDRSEKTF